ncbi:DUF664 domain-containing protein [Kineosporia sp. R_H_3]|uniref:mycothiol transferase n=1 Tax=Kineosporia sp. R_H_3 TaxID=1961848 RepID=UPI001E3B7991|nr:DUF664 domain-containing protein [Kineosporia sp. R_H_3]
MTETTGAPRTTLSTTIHEPDMTAGEVEMILFALERSRAQFAWKAGGLDAAGLARSCPPSALTLGGLLKHLALVEDLCRHRITGEPPGHPWDGLDRDALGPEWPFTSAADDSPAELYALWQGATERMSGVLATVLADGGLDRPLAWTSADGRTPNLRRLLTDLHDEYARHVGHADLLREAVDGLVGEDPPQP